MMAMLAAATEAKAEIPKPEYQPRRILEDKMFNRLGKFGGVEKQWKEWDFNFQIILKSASSDLKVIFELMAGTTYSDTWAKEIEEKVYADTKEQHTEKYKLDEMIDDLNKDIEELMRVLDRKRKEKEMLELEKQVHERKIEQARMGYRGEIEES